MATPPNAVTLRLTLDGSMGRTTRDHRAGAGRGRRGCCRLDEVRAAPALNGSDQGRHHRRAAEQPAPRYRWLVSADLRGAVARRR